MKTLFVATHLIALGIGYFAFSPPSKSEPESTSPTRSQRSAGIPNLPANENPFFHATSNDYRRLFPQILSLPEPRGPLDRFIVDWARLDPEGALLAYANYYDLQNSDTVLSGLQHETGSLLAPVLVEHYHKLHFVEPVDIKGCLERSLAALAAEDLEAALGLLKKLPANLSEDIFASMTGEMSGPLLVDLLGRIPLIAAGSKLEQSGAFWEGACSQAWRTLPPEEFNRLFHELDNPLALKHLTRGALKEAKRFNKHAGFMGIYHSLPREKQAAMIVAFKDTLKSTSGLDLEPFRKAALDSDAVEFIEMLDAHSDSLKK